MGATLHAALAPLRDHPLVGDVRGRGLLAGIELVADRAARRPFARAERIADRVAEAALAAGLVCWPHAGGADGVNGDVVCLAPPFVVTAPEVLRTGAGRALMQSAITQTKRLYPGQSIRLGAQRYLEKFYGSLGFEPVGEPYDEDGIPHIEMVRPF